MSVVCACMNRLAALQVSLTSWLLQPEIRQIVIVDWSSTASLAPLVRIDPRVEIVRVEGETRFHLAAALNLAADHAVHPVLLKLDVDYMLNPYKRFFAACSLPDECFLTGHWRHPEPFFKSLNGLLCVRAAAWRDAGGYDERLIGWGWEDEDFYGRLGSRGLVRKVLPPQETIAFHIPHGDAVRLGAGAVESKETSADRNRSLAATSPFPGRLFAWDSAMVGDRVRIARKRMAGPA